MFVLPFTEETSFMRDPGRGTRYPLVYLGGMSAVRWLGRLASAICIGCAVAFVWSAPPSGHFHFALAAAIYAAAVLCAVSSRLAMLHSVVVTRHGWMLRPLVGRAKFMAPIADVYERGDDVVALGIDGRTTLLGIHRFPFRNPADIRRALVETLDCTARLHRDTA